MKNLIIIICCFLFAENASSQIMTSSFHAANNTPNFITGGMSIRYEVTQSNSYSGTSTITDLLGNVNATLYNSPAYSSSGIKNLNFASGSSNYILTGNIGSTYNESVFMWVYPTGNGVILSELGQAAISSSYHDSNIEMVGGTMKFSIWNSGIITSSIATPLNTWYYVGFTYDGTTLTAYVNGAVAGTTTVTRSPPSTLYFGIGAADSTNMGAGGYGNFKLNAFHYYKRALSFNEVLQNYNTSKSKLKPDGTSYSTASTSAYQIKLDYPNSPDGFYWIKNANINGGVPFKIYADMTTDGGGWTLIMKNSANVGWTYSSAISLNTSMPFSTNADVINTATANYSIIGWADYIKKSASGFQYMIDATNRASFGGIWTANDNYSFIKTDNSQTNVTLNTKFGDWNYVSEDGIMQRMPWYSTSAGGGCGFITIDDGVGNWWGTLVTSSVSICNNWIPTPWIDNAGGGTRNPNPGIIWYWVR